MFRFASVVILLGLGACNNEPAPSYCEAVCDWAVSCAATERDVDEAALTEDCLTATRATDASCAKAEEGKMNPATRKAVEGCVNAIESKMSAGECDPFTGTIEKIKLGAPPAQCAVAGGDTVDETFDAARDAVLEDGAELCQRFTSSFCERVDTCLVSKLGNIPQVVIDQLGTPYELCVQKLDFRTQSCADQGLYDPEESLTDVNTARQTARMCLEDVSEAQCDALLGGDLPPTCAGAFVSTDDAFAFGKGMLEVATDFSDAMDSAN